jgi:activator of HSP90 ATPase
MGEAKINNAPNRRQLIADGAKTLAGVALGATLAGAQEKVDEPQSTGPDKARTSLHQEVDFNTSPHRIYDILLDAKQFSAFSGEPAEIVGEAGGAFSLFGGKIVGRHSELVESYRRGGHHPGSRANIRL